jgi:hypothetical protein
VLKSTRRKQSYPAILPLLDARASVAIDAERQ